MIKRKTEGSCTYVGRNAAGSCYQKFRSYYQIIGRPCHPEEEEEDEEHKGEMRFLKIFFLWIFLTFWLSYSTYGIITASGTQQINFMEKFCVKAGISCIFI